MGHLGGCGVGMLMLIAYGLHRIKKGIKTQNDTDSIVGILCLLACAAVIWAGVTGRL